MLRGLSPATLYRVTVSGVNRYGTGPPSLPPFTLGTRGARLEDDSDISEVAAAAATCPPQLIMSVTLVLLTFLFSWNPRAGGVS